MGIFFYDKPRVSRREFQEEIKGNLRRQGWTDSQIRDIDNIFRGDLDETSDSEKGIDKNEINTATKWMRENKSKHHLQEEEIAELEETLRKYL